VQDVQARPRVVTAVPPGSPAYDAGLERDDFIVSLGGVTMAAAGDVTRAIRRRKPGDTVQVVFERRGQRVTGTLRLVEDPEVEVVLAENAGQTPTAAQKRFRDAWLSSAGRNAF
jgi:predicted metalloprotease with PDZ domain